MIGAVGGAGGAPRQHRAVGMATRVARWSLLFFPAACFLLPTAWLATEHMSGSQTSLAYQLTSEGSLRLNLPRLRRCRRRAVFRAIPRLTKASSGRGRFDGTSWFITCFSNLTDAAGSHNALTYVSCAPYGSEGATATKGQCIVVIASESVTYVSRSATSRCSRTCCLDTHRNARFCFK